MTEIEIKAHVEHPGETEKKIAEIAVLQKETVKSDTYWKRESEGGGKPVKVRFREEGGATIVTYKRKEIQGQIEVNDEHEFTVSDRLPFEIMLADLGLSPYITKTKHTKSHAYTADDGTPVTIELSLIEGLGHFIELEILADNPDGDEIRRAQAILKHTLSLCGIAEQAIESRFYTELLAMERDCQDPKK